MKQNIYKMNLNKFLEQHKGDLSGKWFLLDFRQGWCYEFDARGLCAATGEEVLEYVNAARGVSFEEYGDEFWYFGATQSLGYESPEDFFNHFTVTEITVEEYSLLKHFGCVWAGFGQFPDMSAFPI